MSSIRRNLALITSSAVIASVGIGGVMAAQADNPAAPNQPSVEHSDEGGADEVEDGPDQGPDADLNEPGHQDADESGESE